MFAEMFPVRPYPLDITAWMPAISGAAVEPIFSLVGMKAPQIDQLFDIEDGIVIRFKGNSPVYPTPAILLAPARLVWLSLRYNPLRWRSDPLLVEAQSRARILEARDLQALTWEGLMSTVQEALSLALPLAGEIRRRYYPRALLSAELLWVALKLLGQGNKIGVLLSGTESTTLEANQALEKLATQIRSVPKLADIFTTGQVEELKSALEQEIAGRAFLAELSEFLERYGHREVVLSTALQPTWKDKPGIVLGMLKGLAQSEPDQKTSQPDWKETLDALLALPLLKSSSLRSLFIGLFKRARYFFKIREDTHFEATRILPILRRTLLEMGRRLTEAGALDTPAEVFHLQMSELASLEGTWPPSQQVHDELRSSVQRRMAKRAKLEGTPLVDPQLYRQLEPVGDAVLKGTSGSPGLAQGPARIIHDSSEFGNLLSGDVLVAPYTNPAWTPLFQRAVAVVVDGGSAGSHAAIVAREYGLPAVMGTVTGTQKLHDGEWVQVDGYRGIVNMIDPPASAAESTGQEKVADG